MCYTRQYQNDKLAHPLRHRLRDATSPKVGGLDSHWDVSDYVKSSPFGRGGIPQGWRRGFREKIMQYQLLASDFDNTLVPFGEPCPRPAVVKAVKKMQAAGGKFVLSTGRGYCVINKQQLGGIRFDYVIANNGACVVDRDGAIIAEHPMTNEEMYALVDFCEDYNYPLQFNFRDGYYAYCEYESLRDFYAQLSGSGLTCKDGEDQDRHLIDMPHAAFACLPDEALEAFNRKYGHLNLRFMMVGAVREGSWHCYDIVREGVDKGVGLADLCETVGLTLADAVAAGDSANDVGMLKAAGLGCCMANGTPDAKAAADRIIGDVREDGMAALIEELWFDGPTAVPSGRDLGSPWDKIESAGGQ